jgi:hypothetical protein
MQISISVFSSSVSARVFYRSRNYIRWQTPREFPIQWYREGANGCTNRAEQSLHPFTRAAYRQLTSAWFLLAGGAEQLARRPVGT